MEAALIWSRSFWLSRGCSSRCRGRIRLLLRLVVRRTSYMVEKRSYGSMGGLVMETRLVGGDLPAWHRSWTDCGLLGSNGLLGRNGYRSLRILAGNEKPAWCANSNCLTNGFAYCYRSRRVPCAKSVPESDLFM